MKTTPKIKQAAGSRRSPASCCASFVRMFKPQFAPMVEAGTKLQTVRPKPKRMPKPGDKISLRCWTDKPYRSKQRVLMESTITEVSMVDITENGIAVNSYAEPCDDFARADGFRDFFELRDWFRATHGLPFYGIVIHWHNAQSLAQMPAPKDSDS
jgi:hypothetical protein